MADEHNSKRNSEADNNAEEAAARHELDAQKLEEEREALNKAREQQENAAASEENESNYGNLHYGDDERGDYVKDAGGNDGAAYSSNLNQDGPDLTDTAKNSTNDSGIADIYLSSTENEGEEGDGENSQADTSTSGESQQNLNGSRLVQSSVEGGVAQGNENADPSTAEQSQETEDENELARTQVNDAPTDIQLSDNTVVENESGAVVATLTASDPDANETVTFSIANDPSGLFEVVGDQLKLKDGVSVDYESQDVYQVTLIATDEEGATYEETVTINVADANDAPEGLTLSNANIAENDPGAVIGDLSLIDQDAGDAHSFVVSDSRFEVVNGQLKLKDGVSLDHETNDAVVITVTATDSGGLETQADFEIVVGDVNEAPDDLTLSNSMVAENAAGAVVGDLSLSDVDAGDSHTYTVSDNRFEVVDGQLKLKDGVSLNHEEAESVSVTVTATDTGGLETQSTFDISVADENEGPTSLELSGDTVNENDTGAVVATLTSSDPDAGDTASYAIANDTSDLFEVVGDQLKLKDGVSLDHEGQDAYEITLEVTDSAGASHQETVTINVADVNEGPTSLELSGDTVNENNAGAVVATLTSSDSDARGSTERLIATC